MTDTLAGVKDLALHFAQITDVGERETNQDALGSAQQDSLACFVISDGAGGHNGGETAANIVVKAILDGFLRELSFSAHAMRSYVDRAIAGVAQVQKEEPLLREMSATVAAVIIDQKNRVALWAHLGDTRIYLFRRRKLHAMTADHSLVQQFIDAGYCTPDQSRTHAGRNILFAAIGAQGDTVPAVTEAAVDIESGDAFFICTDGFWEWVTEQEMERALAQASSVDGWLAAMKDIADQNSGATLKPRDNYTAFTIWLEEPGNASITSQ
jgi:PPM family protein phosphatase